MDGLRLVHPKPTLPFAGDSDALQNLALERGSKSLRHGDLPAAAGHGQLFERVHAEQRMELHDRLRLQPRDRKQLEQARRELAAHALQRLVGCAAVKRLDPFGNGDADTRDALQRTFPY